MIDFAAIEIETANHQPTSICSVSIIMVRHGQVVERIHRWVRPVPNFYSRCHTEAHGISARHTDAAEVFPRVWDEVAPIIGGLPLVVYNSHLKETYLRAVFSDYDMLFPNFQFECVCCASRKRFGSQLPNHSLSVLAAKCGFELGECPQPITKAEAVAHIALKIM